ncbi:MAG: hypothetical protein KDE33_25910, partial [Bacteroidetes bacterium]|nr:hypothetical protein [Bacteroidota bacterium]
FGFLGASSCWILDDEVSGFMLSGPVLSAGLMVQLDKKRKKVKPRRVVDEKIAAIYFLFDYEVVFQFIFFFSRQSQ